MEIETLMTFIIICGLVWGGFIYFLTMAIKNEIKKNG